MNISRPKLHNKNAKHAAVNRKGQKGWRKTAFPRGSSYCRRACVQNFASGQFWCWKMVHAPNRWSGRGRFWTVGVRLPHDIAGGVRAAAAGAPHTHSLLVGGGDVTVGVWCRSHKTRTTWRHGPAQYTAVSLLPAGRRAHAGRPTTRLSVRPSAQIKNGPEAPRWKRDSAPPAFLTRVHSNFT